MQSKQFRYILFFSLFALFGVSLAVYAAITFDGDNSTIWYGPNNIGSTDTQANYDLNSDYSGFNCIGTEAPPTNTMAPPTYSPGTSAGAGGYAS